MANLIKSYPFWLRLWHSINGILCLALIITGLMMQYASPVKILISLRTVIYIHNFCGIFLIFSWVFFILANGLSKNGSYYWPKLKIFKESIIQFRYYAYGMFKGEPKPFKEDKDRKFNPLQQLAYWSTMYIFAPVLVITGFIMYNIEQLLIDGRSIVIYQICDFIHLCAGITNFKKIIFKSKTYENN
jgi:thiosulfate reductase cytochrome b subunit